MCVVGGRWGSGGGGGVVVGELGQRWRVGGRVCMCVGVLGDLGGGELMDLKSTQSPGKFLEKTPPPNPPPPKKKKKKEREKTELKMVQ